MLATVLLGLVLVGMMGGGGGRGIPAGRSGVTDHKYFTFAPWTLRPEDKTITRPCCVSWPGKTFQAADGVITGASDGGFDGKLVVDGAEGKIESFRDWTCAGKFCVHVASGRWTIEDCQLKLQGSNMMSANVIQAAICTALVAGTAKVVDNNGDNDDGNGDDNGDADDKFERGDNNSHGVDNQQECTCKAFANRKIWKMLDRRSIAGLKLLGNPRCS
eukprot:764002-Hanusia_phi.AAC.2